MKNEESDETENRLRARLRMLIGEIIGDDVVEEIELNDDRLLAYELGLASIEVVALLEKLHTHMGVPLDVLWTDADRASGWLDLVTVRWVLQQASRARSSSSTHD